MRLIAGDFDRMKYFCCHLAGKKISQCMVVFEGIGCQLQEPVNCLFDVGWTLQHLAQSCSQVTV